MIRSREALRDALVRAYAARDEVYRICLFGREASGRHDAYSDIDIIVYSNDPARTMDDYRQVFEDIGPIRATFTLGGTQDWYSEMLLLEDCSPYHKVDFSINGKEDWPKLTVYEDERKPRSIASALVPVDPRSDVAYVLTDVLFSVARFTKCLFRRDIDMYRRWESITDLALMLLYERHFGWQTDTQRRRLGPYESQRLLEALNPEEADHLERVRPAHARLNLASSYQAAVHLISAQSAQKALAQDVPLNTGFVDYILAFLDAEIARYLAPGASSISAS